MTPIDPVHRKLGFIGIGSMGRPIARRLLQAGYKVMVYNRDRRKAEALVECGATVAKKISQLAFYANVILSCLPTDDAVRIVYAGPEGVFANVRPGSVIIEMSTVNPEISRELYKLRRRPCCQRTRCANFRQYAGCRAGYAHAAGRRRRGDLPHRRADFPSDLATIFLSRSQAVPAPR